MGESTNIEWADKTFNPWEGCSKVGPGCDHCYAETRNIRFHGGNWGPGAPRRRTSPANWAKPRRWNADAAEKGVRYRVFCASLADVFDNEVPAEWRADLFQLIRETPYLDWLLLTKRIGNVTGMLPDDAFLPFTFPNIWLGATIVNQEEADRDIPKLLSVPAAVHWLSMEPLLGPVTLQGLAPGETMEHEQVREYLSPIEDKHGFAPKHATVDWVIVGGESGTGARPMHPDWARSLRDQCESAAVPFLFKQWGEWAEGESPLWPETVDYRIEYGTGHYFDDEDGPWMDRVGKKKAGRKIDGRTWDQFPGHRGGSREA